MIQLLQDLIVNGSSITDFLGDVADLAFATFCNELPDSVRFANMDAIVAIADELDITAYEDGTFTIYEDGTVR